MPAKLIQLPCLTCGEDVRFHVEATADAFTLDDTHVYPMPSRWTVELRSQSCEHDQEQLTLDVETRLANGTSLDQIERDPHPVPEPNPYIPDDYAKLLENPAVMQAASLAASMAELRGMATVAESDGEAILTAAIDVAEGPGEEAKLEIFEVYYKRLLSFGDHENEEIGMRASVPVGEDPWEVLARLKRLVIKTLGATNAADSIADDLNHLDNRRRQLVADLKAMEIRWRKARDFLAKIGIDPQTVYDLFTEDEIPDMPF